MACISASDDTKKLTWGEYFQLLTRFKEKHGHTNVPFQYGNDGLAVWVYKMRHHAAKYPSFSKSKRQRLEELGGVLDHDQSEWDRSNAAWVKSFLECVQMREDHGDSVIHNTLVGKWLAWQRSKHRRGSLEDRCSRLLAEIGFAWDEDSKEPDWDDIFPRLKVYKRKSGTTNVPLDFAPDPELACWVFELKAYPEELTANQMQQLKSISFNFDIALPKPYFVKKKKEFGLATAVVTAKKATSATKENGVVGSNQKLKSSRLSLPTQKTGVKTTISASSAGSSRRRSVSIPERYRDDPEEEKSPDNCESTYNASVPQPSKASKPVVAELKASKPKAKIQQPVCFYPECWDRIEKESITEYDVFMGRGGMSNHNPGNAKFRSLIADKRAVYKLAPKGVKKAMAEETIQTVRLNGGRFLREQDGAYWEVPRNIAVAKASQALREDPPSTILNNIKWKQAYREKAALKVLNATCGSLHAPQEAGQKIDYSLLEGQPHAEHNVVTPQTTAIARPLHSHDGQPNHAERFQLPVLNSTQKERPSDEAQFQTQHATARSNQHGLPAFSRKVVAQEVPSDSGSTLPFEAFFEPPSLVGDSVHGQKGYWTEPMNKIITQSSEIHCEHSRHVGASFHGQELSWRKTPNSAVAKAIPESWEQARHEQPSSIDRFDGASQESRASREHPLLVGAGRMSGHEGVARESDAKDMPASWERPPHGLVVGIVDRLVGVAQEPCTRSLPTFHYAHEVAKDGQETSETEDETTEGDSPVSHARNEPFVWDIYHQHRAKQYVWKVPRHPPILPLVTKAMDEVLPWEIPPPRQVESQLTPSRTSRRCPLPPSQIFRGKRADDREWVDMYEQMVRFLLMNGECMDDPNDVKEGDLKLLKWAIAQRQLYWDDKLDLMRQRLLEQIGFVWRPTTASATSSSLQKKRSMVAEDGEVAPNKRSRHDEIIETPTIDLSDTYLTI